MAQAKFKTIGYVSHCEEKPFGLLFRVALRDGYEKVLPYACSIASQHESAQKFGNMRLAELANACGVEFVTDSDQLCGIDFIVEHDGSAIKRLKPLFEASRIIKAEAEPKKFTYSDYRSFGHGRFTAFILSLNWPATIGIGLGVGLAVEQVIHTAHKCGGF